MRLEREFQLSKIVIGKSDPNCKHFVRPIEFLRLPPKPGSTENLVCSIFEAPGPNYLRELIEFGPNTYKGIAHRDSWDISALGSKQNTKIPLILFLTFAIGATECCEILHHGNRIVHGELREDAFHFNKEAGVVKMINFGSGARSFENGLTSAGWSSLSREVGVEHKVCVYHSLQNLPHTNLASCNLSRPNRQGVYLPNPIAVLTFIVWVYFFGIW